jgi:Lrp/AsnC family leucine-responsive transcriptional regulator
MNEQIAADPGELDPFDLAILRELQRDNRTPQRLIAETIGLSAPAVQRRIRRLEETGVISANAAVVDPQKVGQAITLVVLVELDSERVDKLDAAKAIFGGAEEVQQCYCVTGEADFVLIITVGNMAEYELLSKRIFYANKNIKRFRTFVTLDRVKVGLTVPIRPAGS